MIATTTKDGSVGDRVAVAIGVSPRVVVRVKRLTAINAHGEAYLLAAQALGHDELARAFTRINAAHSRTGFLSAELAQERRSAYEQLMTYARSHLAPLTFQALYQAT